MPVNKPVFRGHLGVFFALLVFSQGCAGDKDAVPKNPFEEWKTTAETSQGHSPRSQEKTFKALEEPESAKKEAEAPPRENATPLPTNIVTLKMKKADIKTVLRSLARVAKVNILFKNNLAGEVDLEVVDVAWDQVFKGLLRNNGLTYAYDGNILRILTMEDLEQDSKVSALNEKIRTQDASAKLFEPLVTEYVKIDYADAPKLKETLEPLLSKNKDGKASLGSIMVEEHSNALIITTTRYEMRKLIDIIKKVDRATSQIRIKANIVETSKETARSLGIQWGGMYGTRAGGDGLIVTPGGTTSSSASSALPGSGLPGAYTPFAGNPGIGGQGFGVNFPAAATATTGAASLGLIVGTLGGNLLEAQLSALQKDGKINILSSPSITTIDNQKAFTENGEKVPFATTQTSGGASSQTVAFENAVLRLEITPHVIDGKNLRMKIIVQKDEVDMSRTVAGNPFIIKKQTQTILIVQDGETIVISGLTTKKDSDADTGIPYLKDIPMIGWMFGGSTKNHNMQEVLIFITPTILPLRAES